MSIRVEGGKPKTLNEEDRSVEVIGATEEPVEVFDWERGIINEVLLMNGLEIPKSRQVPLLDTHSRWSLASVLGSFREMKTENGQLMGRVFFSSVPEAEGPFTKLREGHLTDFSIGYRPFARQWVPEKEKATIKGRSFEGPVMVVTRWRAKELSSVPIGADELAKARSEIDSNLSTETRDGDIMKISKQLRAWLVRRGMAEEATDEQAQEFLEGLEDFEASPGDGGRSNGTGNQTIESAEAKKVAQDAIRAERERSTEIRAMCRRFDIPDSDADAFIASDKTVDQARQEVMAKLEKKFEGGHGFRKPMIERDERDKFKAAAEDSLLLRTTGEFNFKPEKPAPGAVDLRGWTLRELARHALTLANERVPGNVVKMVGRALMTGDLPLIMANVANKSLFVGWDTAEETWSKWCGTGSVPDFKTNYSPRASEAEDLEEIPEKGEYQYGSIDEAQETYSIATYGKIFAITRQAIINDDLGALTNIPAKHGEAAARKVGDIAYAVLTANAAMGDGTALFDAAHANVGTGGIPSVTTIGEAIKLMKLQKDIKGLRRLNIRPVYYLAPVAVEGASEVFFNSFQYADEGTPGTPDEAFATTRRNPYSGTYFERVYEARLDDDSATAFYFAARKGRTVVIYFLNGQERPFTETKEGWTVDGIEYKVRIDAGAKAMDWKGLVSNAGA